MRSCTLSLALSVGMALVGCTTLAPLAPHPETIVPLRQPA